MRACGRGACLLVFPGRTYLYNDQNVLYPFGYGLSYTTFGVAEVKTDLDKKALALAEKQEVYNADFSIHPGDVKDAKAEQKDGSGERIAANLSTKVLKVSAVVTNTGNVAGDEVVQLYVRSPEGSGDRRRHHLEGFKRVTLKPGESKKVTFELTAAQLAQFGKDGKQSLAKGWYRLFIGGGQPGYTDNTRCVFVEL